MDVKESATNKTTGMVMSRYSEVEVSKKQDNIVNRVSESTNRSIKDRMSITMCKWVRNSLSQGCE